MCGDDEGRPYNFAGLVEVEEEMERGNGAKRRSLIITSCLSLFVCPRNVID